MATSHPSRIAARRPATTSKNSGDKHGKHDQHDKHDKHDKHDHHDHGCWSDLCCASYGCYSSYCYPSYGCYTEYCCPSDVCYYPSYCETYCEPSYCEQLCPVYGDQGAPVAGGEVLVAGDGGVPVAGDGQLPIAGGNQAPVTEQTANVGQAFEPFHSTYNALPGDSFYTVSLKEFGTSKKAGAIAQFNGMPEDAALTPGQTLTIPSIAADGTLSPSESPLAESSEAPAANTTSVPATPAPFATAGSDDDAPRTAVPAGSTLLVDGQQFGSNQVRLA